MVTAIKKNTKNTYADFQLKRWIVHSTRMLSPLPPESLPRPPHPQKRYNATREKAPSDGDGSTLGRGKVSTGVVTNEEQTAATAHVTPETPSCPRLRDTGSKYKGQSDGVQG